MFNAGLRQPENWPNDLPATRELGMKARKPLVGSNEDISPKRSKGNLKLACFVMLLFIATLACGGSSEPEGGERNSSLQPAPPRTGNTTSGGVVEQTEQFLVGQSILYSWREGEAAFGTYYFEEVHYCSPNRYLLYGLSERTTVLDNVQRNRWQAEGDWDVIQQQGKVGIQHRPYSGQRYFIPLYFAADGRMTSDFVSVARQGRAQC